MSDNQLTDLLLYYAYMEQELEVLREALCSQQYFQPYNLFKLIDCLKDEPKGYLTAQDLSIFLRELKFPTNLPTKTYVENYNQNHDGNLVYSEFLRAILPITNVELREKIAQQTPIDTQNVNERIKYFFAKLLEAEIKLTIQAENYKKQIDPNYFDRIAYQNYVYHSDLQGYFKSNNITTNSSEIQQIFNRIDLLNDAKIDRNEWRLWICPRKSISQVNSNSYKKQQKMNTFRYSSAKRRQQDSTMTDLLSISKQGFFWSSKPPLTNQSFTTPKKYQQQKTDLRAQLQYSQLKNNYKSSKQDSSYKTTTHKPITSFYEDDIQTLKKAQSVAKYETLEPVNYYVQLFLNLISLAKKIERQKILLSQHEDFSLYASFQKLDKGFKGMLVKSDLLLFCKNPNLLINRFGKDNKLRFSEYIKLVEPKDPYMIDLLLKKDQKPKGNMQIQTEISLKLLFDMIEQFQSKIQQAKEYQSKQQFDISEIFYMLAYDRQQLTQQDIMDFLQANQFQATANDVDLLLNEFDYDGDGTITYNDFMKIFSK